MERGVLITRLSPPDSRWFYLADGVEIDEKVDEIREFVEGKEWEVQGVADLPLHGLTSVERIRACAHCVFDLEARGIDEEDCAALAGEVFQQIWTYDPGQHEDYWQENFVGSAENHLDVISARLRDYGFFEGARQEFIHYFDVSRYYDGELNCSGWFTVRVNGTAYVFSG